MDSSSLVSFGHTKGVHSDVAAREVSQHWDDLNLSQLLMTEEERSPKKVTLPSGQMNVVLREDDGTPRSKNPDGSPVKVTKEVLVERHKKKWEKSNHSVLKDRYGAKPHKPPAMMMSSLERLSNPLVGKYRSKDEYREKLSSATDGQELKRNSLKGNQNVTKELFFTGEDDTMLSPQKQSRNQKASDTTAGQGFFLTATEEAENSPQKPTKRATARTARYAAPTGGASRRSRSRSRGPAIRDPLIGKSSRVNNFRSKIEEAGRVNQANMGANRMRSSVRGSRLQQSVLEREKAAKVPVVKKRGSTPAATGRSAIRGEIKSSGYGSMTGYSRVTNARNAGKAKTLPRPSVASAAGADKQNDSVQEQGRKRGNPTRGRFGAGAGAGSSGRGTSRSRGASTTRASSSRGISNQTAPSAGQTNAEKAAARRAKAAESRANAAQARSNLRSSASDSRLRSRSSQALARPVGSSATAPRRERGLAGAGGGGLAAVREQRKQVTSAPVLHREKSVENSEARAPKKVADAPKEEPKREFTPPVLQSSPARVQPAPQVVTEKNRTSPSPTRKDKKPSVPLSKKEMLKTALPWRSTADILRTLAVVQESEVQRIKDSTKTLVSPMKEKHQDEIKEGNKDDFDENDPSSYTTQGIARGYAAHMLPAQTDKENARNVKSGKKVGGGKGKSGTKSDSENDLTTALIEKATRLQGHFNEANKGFVVDEAEALARSLDTSEGVPEHIRPKMALQRGPQSGRAGLSPPRHPAEDDDAAVAFARALAADRRSPAGSPLKIV